MHEIEPRRGICTLIIRSLPEGGFVVQEMGQERFVWPDLYASRHLDEVLDFVKRKMAKP